MWFDSPQIRALVDLALTEDVGTGDHATEATIDAAAVLLACVQPSAASQAALNRAREEYVADVLAKFT